MDVFEESFPKDLERWFRACGFRCGFSMECFVWCSALFLKCLSKWFSKDFLEKGKALVCKRFWKVFFGVFCLQRLRGCRIVLVDPGGMKLLQMLSTSPRLRSENREAEEITAADPRGMTPLCSCV